MARAFAFLFLGEGSSDTGLIPALQSLVLRAGADEATGVAGEYHGTVAQKLQAAVDGGPNVQAIFVHRDADSADHLPRRDEICSAAASLEVNCVPVIPVQETEAWLLLDETAIRRVVGRQSGRSVLHLPPPNRVETVSDPKSKLQAALLAASEKAGARRDREKRRFNQYRRTLLESLDVDGPIRDLPSWMRLRDDVDAVLGRWLGA